MITMGIDPSLTSTGISQNGKTGVITTKLTGIPRLDFISGVIVEFVNVNHVECVSIEGYSFASKNSQAHSIGELGGVIRHGLWKMGIPIIEIPPTSRAKFATGRGNASKGEVISAISARTGIVFAGGGGNDECDAWVIEEMLRYKLGQSIIEWPKSSTDALDKIDWSPLERATNECK